MVADTPETGIPGHEIVASALLFESVQAFDERFLRDKFTKDDKRLMEWGKLSEIRDSRTPLRTPFERRAALVELDVLVAMQLGLTVDELCTIYRLQFPILYKNDRGTWYDDQAGRVVNPVNACWGPLHRRDVLDSWNGNSLEEIDGYQPAFDRCDREKDYVIAWAEFEKRFGRRKAGTS